jgi:autotransporter-associated beta strand protein
VNYPNIRCFTVPQVTSLIAQSNLSGGAWIVSGPATTGGFTAVGYFMAREIYKKQGIPIGILRSSWGGTIIQAWSDPAFIAGIADFTQTVFDESVQAPYNNTVSGLYNAMILPLASFRIKAVNWYQGEFNAGAPEQYGRMLPGLISAWRSLFGQPNLPFITIELPNADPQEASNWAELREAQARTVANDPNTRLVTTIDIGGGLLHPLDKQDVGLRAAWAAANLVYGNHIVDQAPVFTGFTVSGTNLTCTFTNVGAGLMVGSKNYTNPITPTLPVTGGTVTGFLLAGADKVFYSANATIAVSNTVVVSSPSVSQPLAVRYAWLTYPDCDLYNKIADANGNGVDGLPAGSFRSDPVNKLNVNCGSGTGYYALGSQAAIAASGNPPGEVFDHWSGDTGLIANTQSPSTMVTISQPYESVLANYRIIGAPSGFKATPQTGQVTVSWNSMSWVHYNVKRSTASGGPYAILASSLCATNSFLDTNVTEGITYYYVISATNVLGEGPNSPPINTVTTGNSVVSRSSWVVSASASASGNPPANAIDGDINTRWTTGTSQANGQWFQVDMGSACSFYQLVLDAGSTGGYPQSYQVNVSNDGVNWGSPVATGTGSAARTTISFPSQTARFIRVTQTGTASTAWSICECYVYATASTPAGLTATPGNSSAVLAWTVALGAASYNVKRGTTSGGPYTLVASPAGTNCNDTGLLNDKKYYYVVSAVNAGGESANSAEAAVTPSGAIALSRAGWIASASLGASPSNAIDGDITTRWTTGASQANGQWFQVDMGSDNTFSQLVLDAGSSSGDYPRGYQVNLSEDGTNWGAPVAEGAGASAITTINFGVQTVRFIRVTQTGSNSGWWSIHEFNLYGGNSALTQTIDYTNNTAGNWSSVVWLPNPPGQPSSGVQTANVFANGASINSTNDLGSFTLNQLVFAGQSVNLSGNPLVFDGIAPLLTNSQDCAFAVATPLVLNQTTAFGVNANRLMLGGGVSGPGGIAKTGPGTLILTGTNTCAGGTTITKGILQLGDGVSNGIISNSIANNSPALGGLTFNNALAQTNVSVISGVGSVIKTGAGTLTWSVAGNYTGPTGINGGTIMNLGFGINGLGAAWSPVTINSNASWVLNGTSANVGTLALTNGNCGTGRNGNVNFSNVVSSGTSSIGVSEMRIGADQANGNYTALFTVSDGTLTLNINRLYNGTSSARGSVVKAGAGVMAIANLNQSYQGSTTISAGTLTVSPTATLGTGNLSVSNGATCVIQNAGALASGAYVYLNGTLNLAYSGTNTVGRLYIGGVLQPAGVWNAAQNGHFAGAGSLSVTAGSATGPIVLQARGLSAGGLQLTWTNSAVDLYYTPSLTPPVAWSPVTTQAGFSNGQWTLTLPTGTNSNGFYRLQQ